MNKFCFLLYLIFIAAASVFSLGDSTIGFLPESYYTFENAVYAQTATNEEIAFLYQTAKTDIALLEPLENRYAANAGADYLHALHIFNPYYKTTPKNHVPKIPEPDHETVFAYLASALTYAENSLKIKQTAFACVIIAQILMIKDLSSNPFELLSLMQKITELTKTALTLDPENIAAQCMGAGSKIMSPPIIDNPKKGIELILQAESWIKPETSVAEKFNVYILLAQGYKKVKNDEETLLWLQKAEAIFPLNHLVLEVKKSLEKTN